MFEAYCSRLLQATTSAASQMYISNQQLKMISHSMTGMCVLQVLYIEGNLVFNFHFSD